jgi:hypothetical protein
MRAFAANKCSALPAEQLLLGAREHTTMEQLQFAM